MILSQRRFSDGSVEATELHRQLQQTGSKGNTGGTLNSRTALLVCALICFVIFFYFMLSVVCQARRTSRATNISTSEAIREAIVESLSKFQRRALLESFFSKDKFKAKEPPEKKITTEYENPDAEASEMGGSIHEINVQLSPAPTPTKKADEETPSSPLTQPILQVSSPRSCALYTPVLNPSSAKRVVANRDISVPSLQPRVSFPIPPSENSALDTLVSELNFNIPNESSSIFDETASGEKDLTPILEDGDQEGNLKEDYLFSESVCSICLDIYGKEQFKLSRNSCMKPLNISICLTIMKFKFRRRRR